MKYLKKFESYVSEKLSEQELDRILDKISKSGIESLTKREKAELDNADNPNFKYVETPEPKQTEYKPNNNKEKMETGNINLKDLLKIQKKYGEDFITEVPFIFNDEQEHEVFSNIFDKMNRKYNTNHEVPKNPSFFDIKEISIEYGWGEYWVGGFDGPEEVYGQDGIIMLDEIVKVANKYNVELIELDIEDDEGEDEEEEYEED